MRCYALLFFFTAKTFLIYSQNKTYSPDSVLKMVSAELGRISSIRYENTRELNYSSENYRNISKWTIYHDFRSADSLTGFRYQIDDSTVKQVFNGTEKFELNNKAKTIKLSDNPTKISFGGISSLYNSIVTLRNILPILIEDKTATKTISDTIINNNAYKLVDINIGKRRIQNLGGGFDSMKTKYNFIYRLIIDNKSFLPLEVIQANDMNNDFIKTSFTAILTNPNPPAEISWYYSSYLDAYKLDAGEATQPLLPKGAIPPAWSLNLYNEDKSLHLNELKGNVILIDFWIKNCGPCIQSVPHLNALNDKFRNKNFKLISINSYDSKDDIKWFYEKHKIKYTVLMNGKNIAEKYGVSAFPSFFIIDKTGKIIYSRSGYDATAQSEIEGIIKALLD